MKTTTTTAKAITAAVAVPAAKEPTKMDRAKILFAEVFSRDYELNGDSQRKVFIARSQAEIGLSKAGANTYFQNLSNQSRGKSLYEYNKYAGKGAAKPEAAEGGDAGGLPGQATKPTKAAVAAAEKKTVVTAVDLGKRWQIQNPKGVAVNSFGTKKAAEEYVAQVPKLKLNVVDTKAS